MSPQPAQRQPDAENSLAGSNPNFGIGGGNMSPPRPRALRWRRPAGPPNFT